MTATGTRAVDTARRAGIAFMVHELKVTEPAGDAGYGAAVAAGLGADPDRVFKTLVADVDGRLTVGIVPVSRSLDLKALASAVGGKRGAMAPPTDAERATGYVVGGISPLGQRRRLPIVLDASAAGHPTVFVSAGRRGLELELAPDDLIRVIGATMAPVAR
jgi:Cys-tRNA(Pro)/Cys-tRNA(Cys) deacylase